MNKPDRLFDVRTVRRNIAAGLVTEEEYQAWLDAQEDCAALSESTRVQYVHRRGEDDGDDS